MTRDNDKTPLQDQPADDGQPIEGLDDQAPTSAPAPGQLVSHGPMGQGSDNVGRFADDGNRGAIGSRPKSGTEKPPASSDR